MSQPTRQKQNAIIALLGTIAGKSSTGGGVAVDRELVVSTYLVKTAFTGASVGDTITCVQVLDLSGGTPSTVSTIWRNQTTAADLGAAPSAANLSLLGKDALTDAQLRASALTVRRSQAAPAASTKTLGAATKQDILAANANLTGARILNWTAAPVYIQHGTGLDPAADAPSDYVPAAANGVPGQWEAPFAPVAGLSAKGAAAGNLTVVAY